MIDLKRHTPWFIGVSLSAFGLGCGSKSDSSDDKPASTATDPTPPTNTGTGTTTTPDTDPLVEKLSKSGSLALTYAVTALSSSQKAPSVEASLALLANTENSEEQSSLLPNCSNVGRPWDLTTDSLMATSSSAYAQAEFYCQTNSDESPDTIAGSIKMSKAILCSLESSLGTIDYTADGKIYKDVTITPTTECGFSEKQIEEVSTGGGLTATVKATALSSGDWQRKLDLSVTGFVEISLYTSVSAGKVAVKFVELWDADQRGDGSQAGAAGKMGTRGSVISVDRATGTMRAEYADTYWGRHSRLYAKGSFDTDTGEFGDLSDLSGAFTSFGVSNNNGSISLWGSYSSVEGTATGGFKYNSAQISGGSYDALTFTGNNAACVPTNGCTDNDGIVLTAAADDVAFMAVGAHADDHDGSRTEFETWFESAGDLSFSAFTTAVTP